jgi:hypothetical protein
VLLGNHWNTHASSVAFRYKLSLEIIRVFGTSATPSLVHHQNPHIAPAISPASRNNRTLDHAKKRGGSLYVYQKAKFAIFAEPSLWKRGSI